MGVWSRPRGLGALYEAAAYSRCHGYRTRTIVVVRSPDASLGDLTAPSERPPEPFPARPGRVSGEQLRQRFEQVLEARQKQD